MKIFHEQVDSTSYECWLEIYQPDIDNAGPYKCLIENERGQLVAKLNLEIEGENDGESNTIDAPTFVEKPKILKRIMGS